MNSLWIFSNQPSFYLAPNNELLVNQTGTPLPSADQYATAPLRDCHACEKYCGHLSYDISNTSIIVLVAGDKPFNSEQLNKIPDTLPILAIITKLATPEVCQQLNDLAPDGSLFGDFGDIEFTKSIEKIDLKQHAVDSIKKELEKFTNLAFTAMTSAAEMGVVALFSERAQLIMDLPELAQSILGCFSDLDVEGVIQFSLGDEIYIYPKDANKSYKTLLSNTREARARIVSVGRYLVFSFNDVQILIVNAPCDDVDRYGRLRDILAQIASVAESRFKTLRFNILLKHQQLNSKEVMTLLEMASSDNEAAVLIIMRDLSFSLREMASGFELTLDQEKALLSLSEHALESLDKLNLANNTAEQHFRGLLIEFNDLMGQLDNATSLLSGDIPSATAASNNFEFF